MAALLDGKVVTILSPPDFRDKLELPEAVIDRILTDALGNVLVDSNGNVLNN